MSACFFFPQYMKNLELEAEKANQHVEKTLLPKETIEEGEEAEIAKEVDEAETSKEEVSKHASDDNKDPETERITPEEVASETKKDK